MIAGRRKGAIGAWLLVIAALVLAVGGILAVRYLTKPPGAAPLEEKRPVVAVQVEKATMVTLNEALPLNGTIAARDKLAVSAEANGLKIQEILVEEGDTVSTGQTLAVLNTDVLRAKLAQLQARRDQQVAQVAKARQPERPLEIAQLESSLRQAEAVIEQEESNRRLVEAALSNAEANLNRYSNLYSQGAVAQTEQENRQLEVERQRAQLQGAKDRIEAAKFAARQAKERLLLAQQGGRREDIEIAQAQLRELDAQIQETNVLIDQGRVVAPAGGWILTREAKLGDVASAGKVLFEIAKDSQLEMLGQVPEVRLGQLKVGQIVAIRHSGKTVQGRIWQISPQVDEKNRNAEVRIALPPGSGLRPGMFAEASAELGEVEGIGVPLKAVRGESPQYYVFLLEGKTAKRQNVKVTDRQEGKALISEGLSVGQEVITEGGGFLRDGDAVTRS